MFHSVMGLEAFFGLDESLEPKGDTIGNVSRFAFVPGSFMLYISKVGTVSADKDFEAWQNHLRARLVKGSYCLIGLCVESGRLAGYATILGFAFSKLL